MLFVSILALCVVVALCVAVIRVKRAAWSLRGIPGPSVHWFMGSANSLLPLERIHSTTAALHDEFGDIFKIILPVAMKKLVFIRDPALLKHILSNRDAFSQRGPAGDGNTTLLPQGLSSMQTGHQWAVHRRALSPLFSDKMLRHYSNTILQVLDPLLSTLRSGSGAHDIHCMLERCSLDIIGKIGFETDFQSQKTGSNPFSRAGQAILAEASRRLFQPKFVWKALEVVQARAARQGLKLLRDTVDSAATASATRSTGDKQPTTMLQAMLQAVDPETKQQLTREEQSDELINVLVAGHESTANMCAWAVHLLSMHPDIQERLANEVASVPDARWESIKDLEFLHCVVKETLRLFPTVPVWARYTSKSVTLPGGVEIPANTQVMISNTAVHKDASRWPDAASFRPSRFLRSSSDFHKYHPFSYLPFGAGPRSCVGRRLAISEGSQILASIFREFIIKPAPGHTVEPHADITLGPKTTGVWIRAEARG